MKEHLTSAMICLKNEMGFVYHLCRLDYLLRENERYRYTFTPNYSVIDLLPSAVFQGIPGLDLSLRRKTYVRENTVPVFISERTPSQNREDLWELLDACGMEYLNQLEWLIRTDTQYSGDRLYAIRWRDDLTGQSVTYGDITGGLQRCTPALKAILEAICAGNRIEADGFTIDDANRSAWYSLLMDLYRREYQWRKDRRREGIQKGSASGHYAGRKRLPMDLPMWEDVILRFRHNQLSGQEAADLLGVSKSTFFRRLKEWSVG